jgi:formate hydrogenlyase subunit 3/multisubunit Na+/H+ antiporter MnhD subunit
MPARFIFVPPCPLCAGIDRLAGGAGDGTRGADAIGTIAGERFAGWRLAGMVGPALLVGALTLVLGIGAQALLELVEPAARTLVDPTPYIEAVRSA